MKKKVALLCLSVAVGALMGTGSPRLPRKRSSQDLRSSAETRAAEQTANLAALAGRRPISPAYGSPCGSGGRSAGLRCSAEAYPADRQQAQSPYWADFPCGR